MKKNLKYALQTVPALVQIVLCFSIPIVMQPLLDRIMIGLAFIVCAALTIFFVYKESKALSIRTSSILAMSGQVILILVVVIWVVFGVPLMYLFL